MAKTPIIFRYSENPQTIKTFSTMLTPASIQQNPYTIISCADFGLVVGNRYGLPKSRQIVDDKGNNVYLDRVFYGAVSTSWDSSTPLTAQYILESPTPYPESSGGGSGWGLWVPIKEEKVGTATSTFTLFPSDTSFENLDLPTKSVNIPLGTLKIIYKANWDQSNLLISEYVGSLWVVLNRLPLKKWTVKNVVDRCFELIEPIKVGQEPRFYLNAEQAAKLDKIISPEFGMTRMNLREQLKQVGGYIHAEPRIVTPVQNANGDFRYEVAFDFFGGTQKSNIKNRYCITKQSSININGYCTELDSSAENLVSQLDWAQGVVTEPFGRGETFYGGAKTLRTETTLTRIEENDETVIETEYPIYAVPSQRGVVCKGYGTRNSDGTITWTNFANNGADVTPYLFESADYFGTLSSYDGVYPFSKAYAIYYTQGEKNIKGLFFRQPTASAFVLQKYAIVNILNSVLGYEVNIPSYPLLKFEVSYLPVSEARIRTTKAVAIGGIPTTVAYNQAANLIETRYYGENLKGVAARLGNVEKTETYLLGFLSDIPKAGMLYDDRYYISAVSVEILPSYIRCMVGLSKDFNRLSEYVGISSNKRMWEVSERQIERRETVYNTKILITDKQRSTPQSPVLGLNPPLPYILIRSERLYSLSARLITKERGGAVLATVRKPVISMALGNSMLLSFKLEDNYSAGQKAVYTDQNNLTGWWGEQVPYGNFYGRYYSHNIYIDDVQAQGAASPTALPQGGGETYNTPVASVENALYRKDSRENPHITLEFSAITDNEQIIIGSALMRNCCIVTRNKEDSVLYLLRGGRISPLQFSIDYDSTDVIDYYSSYVTIPTTGNVITFADNAIFDGVTAWALVTKKTEEIINVSEEDGTDTTQTLYNGGEIILGGNYNPKGSKLYFYQMDNIDKI